MQYWNGYPILHTIQPELAIHLIIEWIFDSDKLLGPIDVLMFNGFTIRNFDACCLMLGDDDDDDDAMM